MRYQSLVGRQPTSHDQQQHDHTCKGVLSAYQMHKHCSLQYLCSPDMVGPWPQGKAMFPVANVLVHTIVDKVYLSYSLRTQFRELHTNHLMRFHHFVPVCKCGQPMIK